MGMMAEVETKRIDKKIESGTLKLNMGLLLWHTLFGILFYVYDTTVILYFNLCSILMYIFSFWLLHKRMAKIYTVLVFCEIYAFMIVATICFGWEYGFQHWCLGFFATIVFVYFLFSNKRKIKWTIYLCMLGPALTYIVLRIWTFEHPCLYDFDNEMITRGFFLFNALTGFSFLAGYSVVYIRTVHKLEIDLLDVASVDPLTGLRNRRRMQELLATVDNEWKKQSYNVCVAMIDVDYFKQVNDTYGHDAGDEVLKELAKILLERHKETRSFHVCRWGGEEFMILYRKYHKSKEEIVSEFEELRKQVENSVIQWGETAINITITIGVACGDGKTSAELLVKEADDNLYKGKESGRNRVVVS